MFEEEKSNGIIIGRQPGDAPVPESIDVSTEEGIVTMPARPYGIGCDIHARSAQISVMARVGDKVVEFQREFATDIVSLMEARKWAVSIIETKSDPPVAINPDELSYGIESTSMYHIIVIVAFGGKPCIVNPVIARAGTKKTDRLDARCICLNNMLGTWPPSYVPGEKIQVLRMLMSERENSMKTATRISNRINTNLLRFGDTSGREGSVTKDKKVRSHVEALLTNTEDETGFVSMGVPDEARALFIHEYGEYDRHKERVAEIDAMIADMVNNMEWETGTGTLPGHEMIKLLTTVPGIGEHTAQVWLCRIVTPRRFANAKALAAYSGFDPSHKVSAGKTVTTEKRKGDSHVHSSLSLAASALINKHSEWLGEWGLRIMATSGKRSKAVSAVARRLVTALYWVQMKGEPFTYDGYRFAREPEVVDMPVEELCVVNTAFRRYMRPLHAAGVFTTRQMVHEYHECRLQGAKGLGQRFFTLVKEFIGNQKPYREHLEEHGS